jgi:RNA polymerase-binding transcription factor DksA
MTTETSAMTTTALTDEQLSLYRSMLTEQWRQQVEDVIGLSYDALAPDPDADADGSHTTDRLLGSRLLAAARRQLAETEDALARLDDGTYGLCGACGQPIRPERLEILPAAALCVACQSRRTAR